MEDAKTENSGVFDDDIFDFFVLLLIDCSSYRMIQ
jgi:hypothetical protein